MDRKHRKYFLGIREKISLLYIITAIIIVALTNLVVYRIYRKDIVEKEFAYMEDVNRILADNISDMVAGIEEKLVSEIEYCAVFSYQNKLENLYVADVERSLKSLATLMKMRGTNVKSIYVLDQFGCSYFYDSEDELTTEAFMKKRIYSEIRLGYREMFPRQGATVWRSYPENPEEIYLIKHYISSTSTDYKGIVCLTFDKNYLLDLLGEHTFASVIYDETGSLLYRSSELRDIPLWENQDVTDRYLTVTTTVKKKNWKLMALSDKNSILERTMAITRTLTAVDTLILLVAVLVTTRLLQGMLRNIMALAGSFQNIHAGKAVDYIPVQTRDETAYLCEEFNKMYRELEQSVEKMARDSTLREKAEYNALLAQMNPHFLYNTLESISSMAKLSGQEEIVRTIHMLSYLLRAAIGGKTQKIPLREELTYISYYLEIQKLVTGGKRLEWDIAAEEDALDCLVPKLLLQPVVENSIIHGLRSVPGDGMIVISAEIKEDCLVLEVDDNGEGARQEKIDRILSEEDPEDPGRDRAHIGIRSVQKRIQILYGSRYGMRMTSAPGNGMRVRIRLPLEKQE